MANYQFIDTFGKYFTNEPFINTSSRENVAHVAIIITYENYKKGENKAMQMCNIPTSPYCKKRILQFLKDGPFNNGTIDTRLELIE